MAEHDPALPTMTMDLYAHPDFATEIGHLIVCSAKLEWHLSRLYALLTDSPHDVARAAFYGISNFRSKIETVKSVCLVVLSEDAAKKTTDLLDKAYSRMKTRNRYAHNPMAYSNTGQVCIMRMDKKPSDYDLEEITSSEIHQATAQLQTSCEELNQRIGDLEKVVPPLLKTLRAAPGPRIRFAKKGDSRPKTETPPQSAPKKSPNP